MILYNIAIHLYKVAVCLASPFSTKAAQWVKGRKHFFADKNPSDYANQEIIWFHCASLGEFEQGRPVMERLKREQPQVKILLTFFSPSGYEVRKNYAGADYVYYLPADTPTNAKHFIKVFKPKAAFFVKYEYWFNYINELHIANIPIYFISVILRPDQYIFGFWGGWARKRLKQITHFFVQNQETLHLLNFIGISQATLSGDTRFDRVAEVAKGAKRFALVDAFCGQKSQVLVVGSAWQEDDKLLAEALPYMPEGLKFIIAPHEVHEARIAELEHRFSSKRTLRFSRADEQQVANADVLIIDSIGMLLHLYSYAHFAYVGGAFGKGLHNTLEAAAFGIPVFFGSPHYTKYQEALDLLSIHGAYTLGVGDAARLGKLLNDFVNDTELYARTCSEVKQYVETHCGATDTILRGVKLYNEKL